MTITYQFETEGENKRIVFKDKDGNDIFDISCISDIHFVRLVDYLVKQINVGQVIECTCSNDVAYKFTEKENLIKDTISQIVSKYNETVQRTDIDPEDAPEGEPEEDPDIEIVEDDGQIPF